MKKEIFASAVLLMLAAVSIWNACHAQKLTSELCDMINNGKKPQPWQRQPLNRGNPQEHIRKSLLVTTTLI